MYTGYITKLKNIRNHPNADRLNLAECFGNTVVISKDYDEIIIESNKRLSDYSSDKIKIQTPNKGGEYLRSNYDKFGLNDEDVTDIYQRLAIYKIKKESASEDKHLIQAINSIDEIDETISKLIERSLYFINTREVIKMIFFYI